VLRYDRTFNGWKNEWWGGRTNDRPNKAAHTHPDF